MKRFAQLAVHAALLGAALAAPVHAWEPQPIANCVEYRTTPARTKAGDAKAVVGMTDVGNLTVMDIDGDYGRNNASARQDLARAFLQSRSDDYDFLVVFTTFEFETSDALAFYNAVRNDVRGIGKPVFDNGAAFGSPGRLQGIVDMAAVSRYSFDAADPRYPQLLNTLAHELMHRWAVGVRFRTAAGADSTDLLGRDDVHWSWFADTDGSVMYGNDWQVLDDGRFRSVRVRHQFNALDLYLAGLLAPAEVPPISLLRGAAGNAQDLPTLNAIVSGTGEPVSIGQIVAAEGPRLPSAADAPKSFNAGLILLKRPGEALPPRLLGSLERLRVQFQQRFSGMTRGRATLRMGSAARTTSSPGLAQIVVPSGPSASDAQVAAGLAWLRAQQRTDGRFEDDPGTTLRDTAYALMALSELSAGDPAIDRARTFLRQTPAASLEDHAWRAAGLPADRQSDVAAMQALHAGDGAYRLANGLQPGALDTQVAVSVLGREDPRPSQWALYVTRSAAWQSTDGSIALQPGGAGMVRPTAWTVANLSLVDPQGQASIDVRNRARGWLLGRQTVAGGFGTAGDSLSESLEVFSLQAGIALPPSQFDRLRNWVRARQGQAGDFGGSVYATSLALLALTRDGAPNLAIFGATVVEPSAPVDGTQARLTAIVENRGGGTAAPSSLRFFDGDPDAGGVPIGDPIAVPALAIGGRSTALVNWNTRDRAGARQIVAVADAGNVVVESSEADNRSATAVTVLPAPTGVEIALASSDLVVTPPTIVAAPVELSATGVLRNLGTAAAPGVLVRAQDASSPATMLAETRIDLPGRGSASFELRFTRTAPRGLRLRIVADADNAYAEADESNNVVEREVTAAAGVDLSVSASDLALDGGSPAIAGRVARFRVRVHNRGASASPPASLDAAVVVGSNRFELTAQTIQIDAGSSVLREFVWTPQTTGAARFEATIDAAGAIPETDESNNAASLDFEVASATGVNLAVDTTSFTLSPTPPLEGGALQAGFTLRNLGADPAIASTAALFAGDPRIAGRELGRAAVPALPPGAPHAVSIEIPSLDLRGDTTFYAVADVDAVVAESSESDNYALRTQSVLGRADLAVSLADLTLDPSRPVRGEPVTATLQVRNLGQQTATGFAVRISEVGAATAVVPPERPVSSLAPGAITNLQWTWTFGLDPETHSLRVELDSAAAVTELREDNNRLDLPLSLQDGAVFASQRYFSPNGDGIQDGVRLAWRLPSAEPLEIEIRNAAGRILRRLIPMQPLARGELIWDGRNDRGRIAPDGDYRAQIRGAAGRLIGSLELTLDTNRSTAIEAIDTPKGRLAPLPPTLPPNGGGWTLAQRGSGNSFTLFGRAARSQAGQFGNPYVGLYRTDALFPALQAVISQEWIARYATQQGHDAAEIVDFEMLPDGRSMVFVLRLGGLFASPRVVVGTTRVDTIDTPRLLGTPQPIDGSYVPAIAGVLDDRTVLLTRTTLAGSLWRLLDLRDGTSQPFAADLSAAFVVKHVASDGVVFRQQTAQSPAWRFVPRGVGPTAAFGSSRGSVLSPDGRSLAQLDENGARQTLRLIATRTGQARVLATVDREPFTFSADDIRYPDQLTMAWVARAGELLVVDARTLRVQSFSTTGESLGTIELPVQHATPVTPPAEATLVGTANSVYLGRQGNDTRFGCDGAETWLAERPSHQWYDASNEALTLSIARTLATLAPDGETNELVPTFEIDNVTALEADLLGGVATPVEAVAPSWMFGDGSRIDCQDALVAATGEVLQSPWALANAVLDVSFDENTLLLSRAAGPDGNNTGGRALSSFLNLPTILRAEPVGRAIRLYGLAADRQFERWELDFAPTTAPTQWRSLTAPSGSEVLLDDFVWWTPPEPGSYLVRLRTYDRAGNVEVATTQVLSQFPSDLNGVTASPRAVSPNGDGVQDSVRVDYDVRRATTVRIEIRDTTGIALRSFVRVVGAADLGPATWTWDGLSDGGAVVPDGRYTLWINEQRIPLLVDTQSPSGAPQLRSPYEASQGNHAIVQLSPPARPPLADPNMSRISLEAEVGGVWRGQRELPIAMNVQVQVAVEDYASRRLRVVAYDLAGNRAIFPLGDPVQELSIGFRVGVWRPSNGASRARVSQFRPNPHASPFVVAPEAGIRYLLPDPPDLDAIAVSHSAIGLVELEYETAPLAAQPQWTVRARAPMNASGQVVCEQGGIPASACPLDGPAAYWNYLLPIPDPTAVAERRAFFARVVGRRADGTRVSSNWLRFEPDGTAAELVCGSGGTSPSTDPNLALRRRLLAQAGISEGQVPASVRMAVVTLDPGDGLVGPYRLSVDGIAASALRLAQVDNGILFDLSPQIIAALPAEGVLPGTLRFTTRLTGARAVGMGLQRCSAQPTSALLASLSPELGAECAATPSGRVLLQVRTAPDEPTATVRRLKVELRDPATGLRIPVSDQTFAPAVSVGRTRGIDLTLETGTLATGSAEVLVAADQGDGLVSLQPASFPVDRSLPRVAMFAPATGARICAQRDPAEPRPFVAIAGSVDAGDAAEVWYQPGAGEGASPTLWIDRDRPSVGPASGGLSPAFVAPTVGAEPLNGLASLRIRAWDWSGAQVCTANTVYLDSRVELADPESPAPLLGSAFGVPLLGLSGRGDFQRIRLPYDLGERVDVELTLHALQLPGTAESPIVDAPLAMIQDGFAVAPRFELIWDGVVGGSQIADGFYGLRMTVRDDCGWEARREYRLLIDRTPPTVAITQPLAGANVGGLVVEVRGTVVDPRLQRWQVLAGSSAAGAVQAPIGEGSGPIPNPSLLAQWSRGSVVAAARISLLATDRLDNSAQVDVPIVLAAPSQLVVAGGIEPAAFSPNGDGVRDSARLSISAARALRATVRIVDTQDSPIRTLATDQLVAPGSATWSWDGRNGSGALAPEAEYRFEVQAIDATQPASTETHRFTTVLDLTPPALAPRPDAAPFVPGARSIGIAVDDPRLERYEAELRRVSDGQVLIQRSGGEVGEIVLANSDALDEAEHRLIAVATDVAGNRTSLDHRFTVDRTAPLLTLLAPAVDAVVRRGGTTRIEGSVEDANLQRWDAAIVRATGAPTPIGGGTQAIASSLLFDWNVQQAEGDVRLAVTAVDRAGNTTRVEQALSIDGTLPVAALTRPIAGEAIQRTLDIQGTATDTYFLRYRLDLAPTAGAASGQYSELFVGEEPVTSGRLAEVLLTRPEGDYSLRLSVEDRAGQSSTATTTLRIDQTPPPTPTGLTATVVAQRDVGLDWDDVTVADFDRYRVYRNGAALPATITLSGFRDELAPEGRLRYSVTALDRAGNESAHTAAVEVLLDRTPPVVVLIEPPDANAVAGVVEVLGQVRGDDDLAQWQLSVAPEAGGTPTVLAAGAQNVDGGTIASWDTRPLTDGSVHRLLLEARDRAGNTASAQARVTVDNGPPSAPAGLVASVNEDDVSLDWAPNPEADLLGYLVYRDGTLLTASGPPPQDLRPFAIPTDAWLDEQVGDGTRRYRIIAIDRAGNLSPPSSEAQVVLDTTPPRLVLVEPLAGTRFETRIRLRAQSPDQDIAQVAFSWRIAGGGSWTALGLPVASPPYVAEWEPGPIAYGSYELRAVARDIGGREDPQPPVVAVQYADLTPPDPPTGLAAVADGLQVRTTWQPSPSADVALYRVYRNGAFGTSSLIVELPASARSHEDTATGPGDGTRTVVAVDAQGNASPAAPPVSARIFNVTIDPPFTPVPTENIVLAGRAAAPGTAAVRVESAAGTVEIPSTATDGEGRFEIAALPLSAGENRIEVRVTDADGNRSLPAESFVDRALLPGTPTGLTATVVERLVTLAWTPRPAGEAIGYRVSRNGTSLLSDGDTPLLTATSPSLPQPSLAIDGDPQTAVPVAPGFDGQFAQPAVIELRAPSAEGFVGLRMQFASSAQRVLAADVEAWSGRRWVPVGGFADNHSVERYLPFPIVYRTQRVRLLIHRVPPLVGAAIAELDLVRRPLFTAPSATQTVPDGQHAYRVAATERFAFESPFSEPVLVEVGDAQPPDPVVLSGAVDGNDAVLQWTASTSTDVAAYLLRRDARDLARVPATAERRYVDAARPNGSFDYSVLALDAFDNISAPSNTVRLVFAAAGPGAPQWVSLLPAPEGRAVVLQWQAGSGAVPAGYSVERAEAAAGPYTAIANLSGTSLRDAPLIDGRTYHYRVIGKDSAGNPGQASEVRTVVPRDSAAPPPPVLDLPTRVGLPRRLGDADTSVCGWTEPGVQVVVRSDRGFERQRQTTADWAWRGFAAGRQTGIGTAVSRDGQRLFVSEFGFGAELIDLDGVSPTRRWPIAALHASFAANGRSIYLVTASDASIRRLDVDALDPVVVNTDFDLVSSIEASPDGRRILVVGIATQQPGSEAAWLWDTVEGSIAQLIAFDGTAPPSGNLQWSPDGTQVLYTTFGAQALANVVALDGTTRSTPLGEASRPARWLPDGRRVLVLAGDAAGSSVREVDLTTGLTTPRFTFPVEVQQFVGDPSGRFLALGTGQRLDVVDATDGRILTTTTSASSLYWTGGHRLVAGSSFEVQTVDAPGSFCARAFALAPGANRIDATARDAALNTSGPSAPIEVMFEAGALPDLALADSDLRPVPVTGRVGDAFSAVITVRNRGAAAAPSAPVTLRLRSPSGVERALPTQPSGELAVGAFRTLEFPLGVLDAPGSWRLLATVDGGNAVPESNEANNTAQRSLPVSATDSPLVELALSQTLLAPGAALEGLVRVSNPGATFDGRLQVTVHDTADALVSTLINVPVATLAFGQTREFALSWPSGVRPAMAYRVRAQLLNTSNAPVGLAEATFSIDPYRVVVVDIALPRDSVQVGEPIAARVRVDFRGGNAALEGARLEMRALSPAGLTLATTNRVLGTLRPGFEAVVPFDVSTGPEAIGLSRIEARLAAGTWEATAERSILVQSPTAPSAVLQGALSLQPDADVQLGRDARLTWRVRNAGSTALASVEARLRVLASAGSAVIERTDTLALAAGAESVRLEDLATTALALGAYRAVLEARLSGDTPGTWRLLATRSLPVTDGLPPEIVDIEPDGTRPIAPPFNVRARVTDRHSGVERAEMQVDAGAWLVLAGGIDGRMQRQLPPLADGVHSLRLRAVDRYGNQLETPAREFIVDSVAPSIVIDGVSDGQLVNLDVTPIIAIADPNLDAAQTLIRLDAQPFTSGSVVSSEGAHVLLVRAIDRAGNRRERTLRFTIDRTPPTLQILAPLDGSATAATTVDVRIASEPGARIALTVGAFTGDATATAAGEAVFAAVPLQPGANTISARATDAAGNTGAPRSVVVTRTDPTTGVVSGSVQAAATVERGSALDVALHVRNGTLTALTQQRFRLRAISGAGATVLATREFLRDLAPGAEASADYTLPTSTWPLTQVALVLDTEVAGAWQQLDADVVQVVDATPPVLSVVAPVPGAVRRNPIQIEARASDTPGLIDAVLARIDFGPPQAMLRDPGDASRFTLDLAPLSEGVHRLDVEARDEAGNVTSVVDRAFTVDDTAPLIAFGGIADGSFTNAASVAPTVAVVDANPDSLVATLDGQPWTSGTAVTAEGPHRIDVTAIDRAGNRTDAVLRFAIDRSPPGVAFVAPAENALIIADAVAVVGTTEALAQVRVSNGAYSVLVAADASGEFVAPGVPLSIGVNTLRAQATDQAGNIGPESTRVVRHAPNAGATIEASITATPVDGEPGTPVQLAWTLSNPGTGAVTALPVRVSFQRVGAPVPEIVQSLSVSLAAGASVPGNAVAATLGRPLGDHEAVVEAELTASNGSMAWTRLASATFAIVDRTPPTVSVLAPAAGSVHGATLVVDVQASDALSALVDVEARIAGAVWVALTPIAGEPGRYRGTLTPLADGATVIEARATDAAGQTGSANGVSIVIDRQAPVVTLSGVPPEDPPVGTTVSPVITVNDATATTLVTTLNGQPYVQGTTITADGQYLLRAVATDAAGNTGEASAQFTIDRTPPTVVIAQPLPGTQTLAPSVLVAGSTEPLASVRLVLGTLIRDGVADANGAFDFADVPLSIGSNTVLVSARDRAGNQGPQASVLVVRTAPPVPVFEGTIDLTAKLWEAGAPLPVPVSLRNASTVNAIAARFRLQVVTVDAGFGVDGRTISLDIAAGVTATRQFDFSTLAWPQTELRLILQHDRGPSGAPDWITLDDHVIALSGACFQAQLFADGFESSSVPRMFSDGFEPCGGIASAPVPFVIAVDRASGHAVSARPRPSPAPNPMPPIPFGSLAARIPDAPSRVASPRAWMLMPVSRNASTHRGTRA